MCFFQCCFLFWKFTGCSLSGCPQKRGHGRGRKKWEEDVYFFIMHFKNKVGVSRLKSSFCDDIKQMTASAKCLVRMNWWNCKLFQFQLMNTVKRRDFEEIAPKTLSVRMEKPHEHEQVAAFLQAVSTFWLFSWSAWWKRKPSSSHFFRRLDALP